VGPPDARAGFWSGFFGLPRSGPDERRCGSGDAGVGRVGAVNIADACPRPWLRLRKRRRLRQRPGRASALLMLREQARGLSEKELPELGDLIRSLAQTRAVVVIEIGWT